MIIQNGMYMEESNMGEYSHYLSWIYRRNLLIERGAEMNKGIINKLNRKIRNYITTHPEP